MPAAIPAKWDREADVVVLGSGAAALTAAVLATDGGAKVLVLEKAPMFGGTTGVSGGMPWVPMNRHMKERGFKDSREQALEYTRRLTMGREADPSLVELYIDSAAEVIDYLEAHTPMRMYSPPWVDYYSHFPGAVPGRSLDNQPFDAKILGEMAAKIRRSHTFPPLTILEGGLGGPIDFELLGKRYEEDIRTMGSALVCSLIKGLLDRRVELLNETRAKELVRDESGAIVGVAAEREGKPFYAGARKAVFLGTGGFEWNRELQRAFLTQEITHPNSPPYNEGDGLLMAIDVGAKLGNMTEVWWQVSADDPSLEYDGKQLHSFAPRGLPANFIVNKYGKRFMNESGGYNDVPRVFANFDPVQMEFPNLPAWSIFDHTTKISTQLMTVAPDDPAPDWMITAPTIRELAQKLQVDPKGLEEQLERWNMYATEGVDPDFKRGEYKFGPTGMAAKPTPLVAPFYAVQVGAGAIGTKGGPRYDKRGQVLNVKGQPIPGLFVSGNAGSGLFGIAYPAAGATVGAAMVMGYHAGKAMAKEKSRPISPAKQAAGGR